MLKIPCGIKEVPQERRERTIRAYRPPHLNLARPKDKVYSPCCGLPCPETSMTEDAEIIEIINIKAHRRVIKRKVYSATRNPRLV